MSNVELPNLGDTLLDLGHLTFKVGRFIHPNEKYPQDAKRILAQAPQGAYIAVGTERGFIGASLTPRATHLILCDRDPWVGLFNRINVELLAMAENRSDYRFLRLHADYRSWRRRSLLTGHTDLLIDREEVFDWWQALVRNNSKFDDFHRCSWGFWRAPFKKANYLFNEMQFMRLSNMAKTQRIKVMVEDLSEDSCMTRIDQLLQILAVPSAVLDLSNAWQYVKRDRLTAVMQAISRSGNDDTLLMITQRCKGVWRYFGITKRNFTGSHENEILLPPLLEKRRKSIQPKHAIFATPSFPK